MTSFTPDYNLPKPEPADKIAAATEALRLSIGALADATNRELKAAEARSAAARNLATRKSAAVQVTTPVDGYFTTNTARNHRIPFRLPTPAKRFRVHIANRNDANDTTYAVPDLRINQMLYIGRHKLDAGTMTGQFVSAPFPANDVGTVYLADSNEYVGPWIETELTANTEYLFSYSFYNPSAAQISAGMATNWYNTATGAVNQVDGVTMTKHLQAPLTIWIETDVLASVPVLGWVGDSLLVGREAEAALHDSPAWCHAMMHRVMPRIYGIAGSRMTDWNSAPASPRWTRLAALGKCESVIIQLGSNDVFDFVNTPATLVDSMKARLAALVPLVRANVSDRVYYATIMPRNNDTWSPEFIAAWREWNDYLQTLPHGAVGCFDFASSVADRNDPDRLAPHIVSADNVHLTSGGYALMANAVPGAVAVS